MKRKIRDWVAGLLWRWGFAELPFWDDTRIAECERSMMKARGELLREALGWGEVLWKK